MHTNMLLKYALIFQKYVNTKALFYIIIIIPNTTLCQWICYNTMTIIDFFDFHASKLMGGIRRPCRFSQ